MTRGHQDGYVLGVDLGTTFTAAAVSRKGATEIVPLGDHAPQIPSAVFLTDAGDYLIGDVAIRRGHTEPGRLAQEFKRRIGDDTRIIVGSTPLSAHTLTAQLLTWVVAHVSRGQGGPPATVVITHPANWGPYRLELLTQAARMAGVHATLCPEPEAAAIHFASAERVDVGQTVAVYDLGGGTFDAAVLRKNTTGFTLLGTPEGIEHLGGLDFDAAVLHHVQESLGPFDVDPDDLTVLAALNRLTRDCTEAKEALSVDNDVTVPVAIGTINTTVRLSRPEFDDAIRPSLEDTISSLQRAMESANTTAEDLSAIVLIGGSSRIPLVTHLLTQHLGRPIALSSQPKHAVALGAALSVSGNVPSDAVPDRPSRDHEPADGVSSALQTPPEPAPQPAAPARPSPAAGTRPRSARTARIASGALALAAIAMALVGPTVSGTVEIGLDRGTGLTTDVGAALPSSEGSTINLTLAGRALPGTDVATKQDGTFNLDGFKAYTAGPLRATVTGNEASDVAVVVSPAGSTWWSRTLTIPGAGLILGSLFAFAYAESLLRPIARGRTRDRAKATLGMVGVGVVAGVSLLLMTWIVGLRLATPFTFGTVVILTSICAGLLPRALSPSRP